MTRLEDLKVGDVLKRLVSGCGMDIGEEYTITAMIEYQIEINNLLLTYVPEYWQLIKEETTTMSTKIEQAEKRIEEAMEQLEAAKLALKEAEKVKKNPLFGEIGNCNALFQLNCPANGGLTGTNWTHPTSAGDVGFTDKKSADLVAEAISTLLLLRAQEGVTSKQRGFNHFIKDWGIVKIGYSSTLELSPKFETKELANTATEVIGEVRIIRMFKILNGQDV